MSDASRSGVAFGWYSPRKKAFIVRRIERTDEESGKAVLEDLGMVAYTRDMDLLKDGSLTKRDGSPRKSVVFYPETKPKGRD